jgi:hypothetical protein
MRGNCITSWLPYVIPVQDFWLNSLLRSKLTRSTNFDHEYGSVSPLVRSPSRLNWFPNPDMQFHSSGIQTTWCQFACSDYSAVTHRTWDLQLNIWNNKWSQKVQVERCSPVPLTEAFPRVASQLLFSVLTRRHGEQRLCNTSGVPRVSKQKPGHSSGSLVIPRGARGGGDGGMIPRSQCLVPDCQRRMYRPSPDKVWRRG